MMIRDTMRSAAEQSIAPYNNSRLKKLLDEVGPYAIKFVPAFSDLVLTAHSTPANYLLRNKFRRDFNIDCVLFHQDQEAEVHTDRRELYGWR
jgi:hypothetical protein